MSLYTINQEIIDTLEAAIDPETGEIKDEELIEKYNQLQVEKNEKIENLGLYIKNLESDADAISAEAKKLTARANASKNKAQHLRDYLFQFLDGEKFSTPRVNIGYYHSDKVNVDPLRLLDIPDEYLRFKDPEPDKKAIKKAIKDGQTIPGCELVENVTIQIK